jgi:hypothetical protein
MERTNTTYSFLLCHAFSLAKLHQIARTVSWERTAKGFGFPFPRKEMIMINRYSWKNEKCLADRRRYGKNESPIFFLYLSSAL